MTQCGTIPRYCLPIAVPAGGWEFDVEFSAGPSSNFTATVPEGTYYMDGSGDSLDLILATQDALDTADAGGAWTVFRQNERIVFARDGQIGDVLVFAFPNSEAQQIYGYKGDAAEIISNIDKYESKGLWRARYCWTPDEWLERDDNTPVAQSVGDTTPDGYAVLDGLGERSRLEHLMRFVPAALVKQTYAGQQGYADYVGSAPNSDGNTLTAGDPNAALQKFWTFCRVLAGPIPPVVRYAPDRDVPAEFKKIQFPKNKWVDDFDAVAAIDKPQPLTYRVMMLAQLTQDEVARPSGAWEDCASEGGGIPLFVHIEAGLAGVSDGEWFGVPYEASGDDTDTNTKSLSRSGIYYTQRLGPKKVSIPPPRMKPVYWGTIGGLIQVMGKNVSGLALDGDGFLIITYQEANANDNTSGRQVDPTASDDRHEYGVYFDLEFDTPTDITFILETSWTSGAVPVMLFGFWKQQHEAWGCNSNWWSGNGGMRLFCIYIDGSSLSNGTAAAPVSYADFRNNPCTYRCTLFRSIGQPFQLGAEAQAYDAPDLSWENYSYLSRSVGGGNISMPAILNSTDLKPFVIMETVDDPDLLNGETIKLMYLGDVVEAPKVAVVV